MLSVFLMCFNLAYATKLIEIHHQSLWSRLNIPAMLVSTVSLHVYTDFFHVQFYTQNVCISKLDLCSCKIKVAQLEC